MTGMHASVTVMAMALVASCAAIAPSSVSPPQGDDIAAGGVAVAQRLYFGRNIPDGGRVSDEEWDAFLAEVVTPRFPSGFTVWRADGQWRGDDGTIVREPSFVLEIIHPPGAAAELAVTEISGEYRRRFRQEAVLRVRDGVRTSLEGS